jgi:hypothetical protein
MSNCVTWSELQIPDGPVLLVLNSPVTALHEVPQIIEQLGTVMSLDRVHVIGPSAWVKDVLRLGIRKRQYLPARTGRDDLELNYFLETPPALQWMARLAPSIVVGSSPHNLYNEEVKDIFEVRVAAVLRDAVLLAHSLPNPYVYLLDTDGLLERAGRGAKIAAYHESVARLLDDFHQQWVTRGRPAFDDAPDFSDVEATFARHLGRAALDFDEASPIPLATVETTSDRTRVFAFVRDRLLQALRQS